MNKTKRITSISIFVALALVLDYIKEFIPFLNMPTGGSINIALIPIVLCSFKLGCLDGFLAGILWWLVSSLLGLNPYFLNIMQYCLDYIIPSGIVGLCSLFYKHSKTIEIELGILFVMIIRTIVLILSGAIYWPDNVASNSFEAYMMSITYNLPYCIFTTIMLMIIIPIILNRLSDV